MSQAHLALLLCSAFALSSHAHAQAPAGTEESGRGSVSSPSGNPAPQEELETYRDADGKVRTQDGRPVNTRDGNMTNDGKRDDSPERSGPGGTLDDATDPAAIE
ncbi:hypothetical protein [Ectopseudomonas hydrolytica]|jgi:hypothetical protein|uniref:hypothetical protein n=1 Tax=Ectopseudomonas hydrolytica TaxID=2493633 RepID=UPI0018A71CC3|nr:hypothetical protein [Pseudomonas hydrolytica]MBF8163660.1 hypothetical protein [Pseudomonas mendocina]UTH34006.1 hypothetical protein NLY38_12130 [Pseudomonas hydrolytica]